MRGIDGRRVNAAIIDVRRRHGKTVIGAGGNATRHGPVVAVVSGGDGGKGALATEAAVHAEQTTAAAATATAAAACGRGAGQSLEDSRRVGLLALPVVGGVAQRSCQGAGAGRVKAVKGAIRFPAAPTTCGKKKRKNEKFANVFREGKKSVSGILY